MLSMQKISFLFSCRSFMAAVFLLLSLPCAAGIDFYLWQRAYTGAVKEAAEVFYRNSSGKLFCIAGELEKDGRAIGVKPAGAIRLDRSAAVIRIHTAHLNKKAADLARDIVKLYSPWQQCRALEVDLDIPESKLGYYAELMRELRSTLPGTTLSATVLPCHLKHRKAFAALAQACDFYVLQVHGLNREKGFWEIFSFSDSIKAVEQARKFNRPFKVALPLYCNNIDRNTLIKPDLQKVAELAKISPQVIGFRLGIAGDGNSLDWTTAAAVCRGQGYQPELAFNWQLQSNGAWILSVTNRGYFAEHITLQIPPDLQNIIQDADSFGNVVFDRHARTVKLRLPPAGSVQNILWARFTENPSGKSPITVKENR